MKKIILAFVFLISLSVLGCTENGHFVAENNLSYPVSSSKLAAAGLSEEQFNGVIKRINDTYQPLFRQRKEVLTIDAQWKDPTVNAMAGYGDPDSDVKRVVFLYGGLARVPQMTEDAFVLVACHEVGHHLGGFPIKVINGLSAEGEADYFATLKCAREIFLHEDNVSVVKGMSVPASVTKACSVHHDAQESALCVRSSLAAQVLGNFFATLKAGTPNPLFETPDKLIVKNTNASYPSVQCRLDTFFQGALCEKDFREDLSQRDTSKGACDGAGARPLCWFAPSL